jgi:hypothetical protein
MNRFWTWFLMIVLALGLAFAIAFFANVSQNGAASVPSPATNYGSVVP